MFVLVRFLNEFDNRPYIVPASNILDFKPSNEEDYDKNAIYSVYWDDKENPENTGTYSSQILLMACKYHWSFYFVSCEPLGSGDRAFRSSPACPNTVLLLTAATTASVVVL